MDDPDTDDLNLRWVKIMDTKSLAEAMAKVEPPTKVVYQMPDGRQLEIVDAVFDTMGNVVYLRGQREVTQPGPTPGHWFGD